MQSTKKILITALPFLILGLAACGKSGDSSPKTPTPGDSKVTTDTAQCSSGSTPKSAIGSWETDFEVTNQQVPMSFQVVLAIDQNQITFTNFCNVNGGHLTSTVVAPARITRDTISVLADATHTEERGDSSNHISCTASLSKMTIHYQASGSCLSMTGLNSNETLIMVPARNSSIDTSTPARPGSYPPSGFPAPTNGHQPTDPGYPGSGYPNPGFPGSNYPGSNYPPPSNPQPGSGYPNPGSGFPTPSYPTPGAGFPTPSFPAPGQYPQQN